MKYMTKAWWRRTKERERIWREAMAKTDPSSPVEWRIDGSLRAKYDEKIRQIDEEIRAVMVSYYAERQRAFPEPPSFVDRLDQRHMARVSKIEEEDGNLLITAMNPAEKTPVTMRFKRVQILLDEVKNATLKKKTLYWHYYEVYPKDNHYEIHILFAQGRALSELILECEDVTFE